MLVRVWGVFRGAGPGQPRVSVADAGRSWQILLATSSTRNGNVRSLSFVISYDVALPMQVGSGRSCWPCHQHAIVTFVLLVV